MRCYADLIVFLENTKNCVSILIYADNIVVIGNDEAKIRSLNLGKGFKIKDLGGLKHFFRNQSYKIKEGIVISQWKHTLHLLEEIWKLGAKPVDSPIKQSNGLDSKSSELLNVQHVYQRLVGILVYLNIA